VELKQTLAAFKALNDKLQTTGLGADERARWAALKTEVATAAGTVGPHVPGSERRVHARAPLRLKAAFHSAAQFARAYTTTLSGGGVSVQTEATVPVGAYVTVEIALPGRAEPVSVQGRVVWVKGHDPCEAGVRFEGVPTALEDLFEALVMESVAWELSGRS